MDGVIPPQMTDAAMWSIIIGFFMPLVINFVVNAEWSQSAKAGIAFAASLVAGAGTAFFTGAYEGLGIPSSVLLTLVVAITSYQNFWKQVAPNLQRGMKAKKEHEEEQAVAELPRRTNWDV